MLTPLLCFALLISADQAKPATVDATALARTFVEQLTKGDYAAATKTFDEKVSAAVPEQKLRALWESIPSQLGPYQRTGAPRISSKGDVQIAVVPVTFAKGDVELQLVYNATGQVIGIFIRPAADNKPFADASYVNAAAFTERDVTVDAGGWPLPATLAMPTGQGAVAGVVLVHGSGPNDRDETIGPNKPFRDLARGLASRGVAVLRYEKRTRQFGAKAVTGTAFTAKEEVVDDAVAAVRLLAKTPGIDPKRVFVLGHSLGGTFAPRIATSASADVAGVIILAGAVRSLDQLLIEQARHLAQGDGTVSADEQRQIEEFEKLQAAVKVLKPGDPAPSAAGIKLPTAYWLDLRDYSPAEVAGTLKVPMLILQGGRDYQVTTVDFELWKRALGARKDAVFKVYPPLNHLFMTGTGTGMPAEYLTAGHVDEEVVRDVAEWVKAR